MNFSEINSMLYGGSNYLDDEYFLDLLHSQKDREMHTKIVVLDWKERVLGEIQGLTTDGSISIDANSSVRRTCSLSMVVNETTVDITDISGLIGLNRKIKVFTGLRNNVSGYKEDYGDIIWFPMGVFILTQGSIRHDVSTNTLSITAQDKMCLLNGEIAGVLQAPVDFAKYEQVKVDENGEGVKDKDGNWETFEVPFVLYDIIRTSVIQYGEENPGKVHIMDLPNEVRKSMEITLGISQIVYVDLDTGDSYTTKPADSVRYETLTSNSNRVGYEYVPFTVPSGELMKQAGDTVSSVLDDIVGILGNYEYYYDVHGNFIFREIRNHINQPNKPFYQLDTGEYVANFSDKGIFYSFVDKDNVSGYSNNPDWNNIKNDFIVWGTQDIPGTDAKIPVMYRVAIDGLPFITAPGQPWQQQLLEYDRESALRGLAVSPYYAELKAKWEMTEGNKNSSHWVYNKNAATQEDMWNESSAYFLDFIDSNSEMGKFSIDNIGRRTKVVVDENVKLLYPPKSSNTMIEYQGDNETVAQFDDRIKKAYPDNRGAFDIVKVYSDGANKPIHRGKVTGAVVLKDAFSKVRELLFAHSTMNEVVSINCLPLYNFDVNVKIEAEDNKSDISGYYMVRSVNIPLSIEGQMTINAIRATNRI